MAINFKLSRVVEIDPAIDDMTRTWVGWSSEHSPQETFSQNRGVWLLGPRAERERYATFSFEGQIRVVASIDRLETVPAKNPALRSKRAVVGRVLEAGDPVHDELIGQWVDEHRNPVTYFEDPMGGARTCACGCDGTVPGHRAFLPGHDQRAVHERITRQWGSTLGFIEWFDAAYPKSAE
ncbi:hypothetical protein [Arthrobacter crystallopoietes]|uniref:Uncharacterized protein n=1 Tax=Crystallibacter crystallopoietes TaxID=37928 RepID=A0A1H1CU12_9MICC|nr:hypothetical protein [Arthrobacter crystallopoietes]SDQ67650.1 hypothetical protein SAMN04489742_2087 [Arthrobacter crystallopoietes]